jgi:hypothetical protein
MMQRIVYGYLKVCKKKQRIVDRGEPEGIGSGKRRRMGLRTGRLSFTCFIWDVRAIRGTASRYFNIVVFSRRDVINRE